MMNKNPNPTPARLSLALLALSAATVVGSVTLSQAQPTAQPATGAQAAKDRAPGAVRLKNTGKATVDVGRKVNHLLRGVELWQEGEDFILYAEDVTHYNDDDNVGTATARGNLHLESRDSTIIGDLLQADFSEKMMTLTGNVVLKSHGEKDGLRGQGEGVRGQVLHKPSSLTCDRLDYDYETRQATLTGSIRMRQGENFGTCDRILFDEARNIVRLVGNVKFVTGERQTFDVPELTIWIDNNIIQAPRMNGRIPGRRNRGVARAPRQPEAFGDAPALPADILEGRDRRPPALAPPAKAAPASGEAVPAASSASPAPSPATPGEPKAGDKPVASATAGQKSG